MSAALVLFVGCLACLGIGAFMASVLDDRLLDVAMAFVALGLLLNMIGWVCYAGSAA